ncbi:MAG: hypothetical protein K6G55_08720 [Selenomonadaceae bacterium]|nr:hypothetical protein [Selenomonadaceae bacterium]
MSKKFIAGAFIIGALILGCIGYNLKDCVSFESEVHFNQSANFSVDEESDCDEDNTGTDNGTQNVISFEVHHQVGINN